MYARTSTWAGTPEALESWVRHVKEKVGPMVAGLPTLRSGLVRVALLFVLLAIVGGAFAAGYLIGRMLL